MEISFPYLYPPLPHLNGNYVISDESKMTLSYLFYFYGFPKMLERIFNNEPCCLLNSYKESELLKVAKEALDPGHSNNNRDKPLPNEVRKFINI